MAAYGVSQPTGGNLDPEDGFLPIHSAIAVRTTGMGLTHVEMHTHVLMTFHGMSSLYRGEKAPFSQRFEQ